MSSSKSSTRAMPRWWTLVKNKTVVVIAHRLNTIARADKIIVIDQGAVIEEGRHEELIARGGLYKSLWEEQQRLKGWKFR